MDNKSNTIKHGTTHKTPKDLQEILSSDGRLLQIWNSLTPLARNEWICWTVTVKKQETRIKHIARLQEELFNGKRRPCCWSGCQHLCL
jgi:uncharacterized protein YdeI (YjbR/CyaY-like superfamily)